MKATCRARRQAIVVLLLSALGASACQDPLVDPAVVIAPRVIGARVRAERDASLAEPSPGERASIDWLLLADEPASFVARAAWCRAEPSALAEPRCQGAPSAELSATGTYGSELSLPFQVPDGLDAGEAWLAWIGVCEGAEPAFDAAAGAFTCPDGEALAAYYRGFIPDAAPNRNPSLADDALSLAGAPWLAFEPAPGSAPRAPRTPCRGSPLPSLFAGDSANVAFTLVGDDREPLASAPVQYAAHARESLVYTHVASHPGLDRAFSAIDYDAQATTFELAFDASAVQPGPDGETLVLHLLVRDERGGVDWLRREACLLAP